MGSTLEVRVKVCPNCWEVRELYGVGFSAGPFEATGMLCHECSKIVVNILLPAFGVTPEGEAVDKEFEVEEITEH